MADATEKGASKEAPFFIAARKRGFFRAQRARGVYAARKGCSFFAPIGRRGFNRSAAALHPFSRASAGGGAACAPLKYPLIFTVCDALIINKIDVLPYFDFDMEKVVEYAHMRNPKLKIFPLSAKTGEGVDAWCNWLREQVRAWNG